MKKPEGGRKEVEEKEDWKAGEKAGRCVQTFWWKGHTEFQMKPNKEEEGCKKKWSAKQTLGLNLSQDVDLTKASEKDLEEKEEDLSESKRRNQAIQVLDESVPTLWTVLRRCV